MRVETIKAAEQALNCGSDFVLYHGDCNRLLRAEKLESPALFLTSPPYFMGKEYDRSKNVSDFIEDHRVLSKLISSRLRPGGSICWQVGYHVQSNRLIPLDHYVYAAFSEQNNFVLRNRIVWSFEHGTHSKQRFSGRHETVLWFTRDEDYFFDLDAVRVPQKYPGKRHYKGDKKGEFSGNPLGKNPGDVWSIPNVKSKHVEKTDHPCQFPLALARRLIRSLTKPGDLVCDPFSGSGTTGIAALMEGRRYLGAELEAKYCAITMKRVEEFRDGRLKHRDINQPVAEPSPTQAVARRPAHFWIQNGEEAL